MEIKNNCLVFSDDEMDKIRSKKSIKITGSVFGTILGANEYEKKGDALLKIFKIIPRETIDRFYTVRGELAEKIVQFYFKNIGYNVKTWEKKDIGYDNFKDNPNFGGMLDLAVTSDRLSCGVEVKSSNIKKRIDTINNKCYVLQAQLYGTLEGNQHFLMAYVFFTDEEELIIKAETERLVKLEEDKASLKSTFEQESAPCLFTLDVALVNKMVTDRRIIIRDVAFSKNINDLMKEALEYRDDFLFTGAIPLDDISEKFCAKLGIKKPREKLY